MAVVVAAAMLLVSIRATWFWLVIPTSVTAWLDKAVRASAAPSKVLDVESVMGM